MTKIKTEIILSYQDYFDKDFSFRDPDLYKSIKLELQRQQQHIELIASENIVSKAVLDAQGSILTNKYAEGYPGKRYYGGCEFVDKAEELALERVKKLFECKYANVQPHSGAQANGAVYLSSIKSWRHYTWYEFKLWWTFNTRCKSCSIWKMVKRFSL